MSARRELCWTFEQEVTLRRMWAEGHSSREIGDKLGVTRCAVLGKVYRLNLPFVEGHSRKTARSYKRRVEPKPPKPIPAKPIPVSKPEPKSRWLTLAELEAVHCHWPVGNGPPFVFCGADVEGDGPYCWCHAQEARKPERVRKSAA